MSIKLEPQHSDHLLIEKHYEKPGTRIGLTAFSMVPSAADACAEFIVRGYKDGLFQGLNLAQRALYLAPLIEPYITPEAIALIRQTGNPNAKRSQVVVIEKTHVAKFTGTESPYVVDDMIAAMFALAFPDSILDRPKKPLLRINEGGVLGEVWHQDMKGKSPVPIASLAGAYGLSRPPTKFCDIECAIRGLPPHLLEWIDMEFSGKSHSIRKPGTITRKELMMFDKFRDKQIGADFNGVAKEKLEEIAEAWRVTIDQASLECVVAPGTMVFWSNNGVLFHRGVATAPLEKVDKDAIVRMVYYTGCSPKERG